MVDSSKPILREEIAPGFSAQTLETTSSHTRELPSRPTPPKEISQDQREQRRLEYWQAFPRTNYDVVEPADPSERSKRNNRNKSYDRRNMVAEHPSDTGEASLLINNWEANLSAIPTNESCAVLTATVIDAQAFLSSDKTGVYSEFTLKVTDVLKRSVLMSSESGVISADRFGGIVHYPWGHDELYAIAGQNMPRVGRQYAFFLQCQAESQDYEIMTAYELTPSGVTPLDDPAQFQTYKGQDVATFLRKIRDSLNEALSNATP